MDAFTHGLASYCVTRAAFPRASRATMLAAILAGSAANIDQVSAAVGPSAFLAWHRTVTHSIFGTLVIAIVFSMAAAFARRKSNPDKFRTILLAVLAACAMHVAMDLTQNEGVQLLWPFRAPRYSVDWVAHFDLWILLILLAGALVPQLLGLVTEEIGAKPKAPRGRIGAIIALLAVFVYIGARYVLHGNALAMMEARAARFGSKHGAGLLVQPRCHGRFVQTGIFCSAGRGAQHRIRAPFLASGKISQSLGRKNQYRLPRTNSRLGRTPRCAFRPSGDGYRRNRPK